MGAFSTETLRQGIEGDKAANLLSLYADDAEIRIVDRNTQPSNPRVLHGRSEIGEMLEDVYSRDIKAHKLEKCIMQGDQVAYTESCEYSDGVRVFAESMVTLRDGKIAEQIMLQAWDE
ncbi:nuclear transport factor 2 family protein [Streptomyces justiciae]|uniref:nuclear transport factor 2 family protein n=1 Tax=Streptomyces justiciae TaxID=2780140 RepID=UPI00187ED451|nr:nuclear transport factor 2 family protein [Streptomyces justiciae]MBE8475117.1 nuclear transport factor 2 family protein [Streptomyces justiciae]